LANGGFHCWCGHEVSTASGAVLQGGRNAVNQFFEAFNEAFANWQPEALPQPLPSPKSPQGAPQRRALCAQLSKPLWCWLSCSHTLLCQTNGRGHALHNLAVAACKASRCDVPRVADVALRTLTGLRCDCRCAGRKRLSWPGVGALGPATVRRGSSSPSDGGYAIATAVRFTAVCSELQSSPV
jgi:hypothetical protein